MSLNLDLMAMTAEVALWRETYVPGSTPLQHAGKVCEEAGELIACEIGDGRRPDLDPAAEAADVLIALLAYMAAVDIDPGEVFVARMRELWCRER